MHRIRLLLLAALSVAACDRPPQTGASQGRPAARRMSDTAARMLPDTITQVLTSDLDGDGRTDTLLVHRLAKVDDPGAFDSVRFVLSSGGSHSFGGSWDEPDSETVGLLRGNRVPSRVTYVARFAGAGTLVFLFGASYGCCLQALDVYRVSAVGVSPYYHADGFELTRPLIPADTVTSMTGIPFLTEIVGTTAPDAVEASG